ncbi:MAG: response regulator [Sulfuricaulis sp.]|nr:response regulator [Sulfuricaulis sp.]
MKVLIVHGHSSFRRMLRSLLEGDAVHVAECGDTTGAMRAVRANSPDWLLLDVSINATESFSATRTWARGLPGSADDPPAD